MSAPSAEPWGACGGMQTYPEWVTLIAEMERQVSIRLPTRLLNELDRRARRRRRPRADVIRAALSAYVELPDGVLEQSPAERVRDLLGSVESLPTALATHADRYLADLGRHRK